MHKNRMHMYNMHMDIYSSYLIVNRPAWPHSDAHEAARGKHLSLTHACLHLVHVAIDDVLR